MTPGERAAAAILEDRARLGRELTAALYEEMPELTERYGARGRQRCQEDMQYNLEHLAAAVGLDAPAMFRSYIRWVDDLLRARNVATRDLVRSLELMDAHLAGRLDPEGAGIASACIAAALEELEGDADG